MTTDKSLYSLLSGKSGKDKYWFARIGTELLTHYELAGRFRITELEFYFHTAEHPDPYVHQHEQQLKTCGAWYWHREKSATKSFTLKGLDLTFGAPGVEYGGILIRGLFDKETKTYIEGPSKTVDAILDLYKVDSVLELQKLFVDKPLALISTNNSISKIYVGKRFGLKEGNTDIHKIYYAAPYRYRIEPTSKTKDRSGLR